MKRTKIFELAPYGPQEGGSLSAAVIAEVIATKQLLLAVDVFR